MSGLLASIVAARRLQPEPVATEALVHLCSSSDAAKGVLRELFLQACDVELVPDLSVTGQDVDSSSEGRPDIVVADQIGVRMVIEAKFDAELTAAQINGAYVAKLAPGIPALLVFLVPADRMTNVWTAVSRQATQLDGSLSTTGKDFDSGLVSCSLPTEGHVLAVMSWDYFLNRLSAALDSREERNAAGELAQIRGLVQWRSRTGWSPLLPDDLTQRTGRQLSELVSLIRTVSVEASHRKTRPGSADSGPGRYLATPGGKSIWFGVWFSRWDRYGPGPLFAQIKMRHVAEIAELSQTLTVRGIAHHREDGNRQVLVPVELPLGAERRATEKEVIRQLRNVMSAVDAAKIQAVEEEPLQGESEPSLQQE